MTLRQIAPDRTEASRFFEEICAQGDCLHLRPQQRVPLPPADKVIVLREGMLAIDAMPEKGKLQVLDFLVAGDVVSASTVLPTPRVSLRAITSASLVALEPPEFYREVPIHDYWTFVTAQCFRQLARVNVHQLMIGRLETEPRVASFVLALALRGVRSNASRITVALPMSRVDIANYLVINCDTLSRTMMRFCDSGLIERESRHAVRVVDLDALKKKSPLAPLLSAVFTTNACHEEVGLRLAVQKDVLVPSVNENRRVIVRPATNLPSTHSNAEHAYAS
jgi:CRP/FNR family transcriptional regulator, anaerobic regulatory protein